MINLYLNQTADITTEPDATALSKICIDMVRMMIVGMRHLRENNLVTDVPSMWSVVPDFTPSHIRMLEMVRNRRSRVAFNYNTTTGRVVN